LNLTLPILTVVVGAAILAACDEPSGGNTCAGTQGIPIDARNDSTFEPLSLQVQITETFCFQNLGSLTRTVTSDSIADSIDVTLPPNFTFSRSYGRIRDFNYHCRFHPGMVGVVRVR